MSSRAALLILYGAISVLAFTGLLSKLVPADAISLTQARSAIASAGFLALVLVQGRSLTLRSRADFFGMLLLGLLMGAHWSAFFHSMQVSSIAIGMLSFYTYPLMTVLLEPLFNRRAIQPSDLLACACLIAGVLLMVADFGASQAQTVALVGVGWGLLAALFMALRNLLAKYRYGHISAVNLMFYQVLVIAFVAAPFTDFAAFTAFSVVDWLLLLLLGFVITAGGHTLIVQSLKVLPAKTVAMISCIQPFLAILIGWAFIGELPAPQVFAGGALIVGVAIFESWRRR